MLVIPPFDENSATSKKTRGVRVRMDVIRTRGISMNLYCLENDTFS